MIYLGTPHSQRLATALRSEAAAKIGVLDSPATSARVPTATHWAADSGCYSKGYPGDIPYLTWLATRPIAIRPYCIFAAAPDVPCEAAPTLIRSRPFLPIIRAMGYPVAFVAQNGLIPFDTPWEDFDVLFIGGTTEWKLGPEAGNLAHIARTVHHKPVHMGRVNSHQRFQRAQEIGCTSADGNAAAYDPQVMTDKILAWISPTPRICASPRCQKDFYPSRSDQKTCSPRCRKALSRSQAA